MNNEKNFCLLTWPKAKSWSLDPHTQPSSNGMDRKDGGSGFSRPATGTCMFQACTRWTQRPGVPQKSWFIISKSRFRDWSAIFVKEPKGTIFGHYRKKNPGYAKGALPCQA